MQGSALIACPLFWYTWDGDERGEGGEREIGRVEILPTPKVMSLDAMAMSPAGGGMIPLGSIRVEKITGTLTLDQLKGITMAGGDHKLHIPERVSFVYEVKEDGRGDEQPEIARFRLASPPFRRAGRMDWVVNLERIDLSSEKTSEP